jgi:hypothetical protein
VAGSRIKRAVPDQPLVHVLELAQNDSGDEVERYANNEDETEQCQEGGEGGKFHLSFDPAMKRVQQHGTDQRQDDDFQKWPEQEDAKTQRHYQ